MAAWRHATERRDVVVVVVVGGGGGVNDPATYIVWTTAVAAATESLPDHIWSCVGLNFPIMNDQ